MNKSLLTANLWHPISRADLIRRYCHGKEVLDIGCVAHDLENTTQDAWLHQIIVDVASSVTGVDYLEAPVQELNRRGYKVIVADVTKPLPLDSAFDVIVIGNLIEHVSNFEGLLENIRRLLKPDGYLLISTANPFYREQYFYSAFKKDIVVNPEHTCWICPVTLDQLCVRFNLITEQVYWVRERWKLSAAIMHGARFSLDIFNGRWRFLQPPSLLERLISPILGVLFRMFAPPSRLAKAFARYGKDTSRMLYVRFLGGLFEAGWALYRPFIVTSAINRHELYLSVLRRQP